MFLKDFTRIFTFITVTAERNVWKNKSISLHHVICEMLHDDDRTKFIIWQIQVTIILCIYILFPQIYFYYQ